MTAYEGFGEIAERLRRSTVQVMEAGRGRVASGCGVLWDSTGLIVTNSHVVRGNRARVELWDGRSFECDVTCRDARQDLASLRISAGELPSVTPRDSDSLRAGELVVAFGNPLGSVGALTTGVVHALGPVSGLGRRKWVQAAVRLAPGNSGGPLADVQGRFAGLNTMIVHGGLALAVPSNTVAEFLREIRRESEAA